MCWFRQTSGSLKKGFILDALLTLKSGATKSNLEAAMNGHVLAQATLMGAYRKK